VAGTSWRPRQPVHCDRTVTRATEEAGPGESGLAKYVASQLDPTLGWADLEWLVKRSPVPVLVKGVVRGDDAERCVGHGAAGVVVSNHGGRQLDSSVATLDALPEVVDAVGSHVPAPIMARTACTPLATGASQWNCV
jgi:isopentenyl diphosphate isomerase/L-lactate dehydrogenase-like FMN-dependent dehydrogenase